jgi:uncharacterized membrane protein
MKVNVKTQVAINAPQEQVFKYLEDLNLHYFWNPHLNSLNPIEKIKKGFEYESKSTVFGVEVVANNRVAKFSRLKEVEIENESGPIHYRINYSLSKKGKQALLTCTTVVSTNSKAFAFTKPIMRLLAQRELQSDLKALKIAAEQKLETLA